MLAKIKRAVRIVCFWIVYFVGMSLAVLHFIFEKCCSGLDFILTRLERLLQSLEYYEKDPADRDSGV